MENKIYLLIDNMDYYPQFGTEDWIGMYATRELADVAMAEQRHAGLADNQTIVAIDLADLTWKEVAHATAV